MAADYNQYSLYQTLLDNEAKKADQIYLRQPRQGDWFEYSWADVMRQARQVVAFLQKMGLKRGDKVTIISKNCAEWFITDFAIALAGMVSVPLFANQHAESIVYILEHAEVKLVFVGKLDNHQQVRANIPASYTTVSFDYHQDMQTDHSWHEVLATPPAMELTAPAAEDLYTIIYTSGTSGMPKGAMYNHQTIANYLELIPQDIKRIRDCSHYKLISYLPLAHVYERTAIELGSLTINSTISFVESLEKFADNLREVQPTFFAAVPRIWGVFQQKIEQKLPPHKLNFLLKLPLISGIIKKKIKHQLGLAECTNAFSGASHLPVSVIDFFGKLGVVIQEGYGQSENLAYCTVMMLQDAKPGYVGTARIGVKLGIGEQDELLCYSDCLMQGYYKNEEATKSCFTGDGGLRTGDVVEMDSIGRVKILGRISENFKNQKGEFIAPTPIEKQFATNGLIEQLCLVGQELPNNVILVSLNETAKVKPRDQIQESLQKTLHQVNQRLANYEKISHVLVVKENWTPENEMLTPTLKVKRRVVESRYHDFIQDAIKDHQSVVWQ